MNKSKLIIKILCFTTLLISVSYRISAQTEIENEIFKKDSINGNMLLTTDSLKEAILSESQKADFLDKALRKTKALSTYISTIGAKSQKESQRNDAIDLAVKLFMNEDNVVEVSSLNSTENKRFKIRDYLLKIKMLPYKKVNIEWVDIFFASNFTQRPDGRYEATVSISQRFSGTKNEGGIYTDLTKKSILIVIDQAEIATGPNVEKFWEVFLGDIKVEETKKN